MKKIVYTFVLLLLASFACQAQTLTIQGNVSNGSSVGISNHPVLIQVIFQTGSQITDTVYTDSLGSFTKNMTISTAQAPGVIQVATTCNGVTLSSIDSFLTPTYTSSHIFNCSGNQNPQPINAWLNGRVSPTALGDSVELTLWKVVQAGLLYQSSYYVKDSMSLGYVNYGFNIQAQGIYVISATSSNSIYPRTFYGNTRFDYNAQHIHVFSSGSVNVSDIQLQTLPPIVISGIVSGYVPSAAANDSFRAILININNNVWTPVDTAYFFDSSGVAQFQFTTTQSGMYAILVTLLNGNAVNYAPTYHDNTTTWTASMPYLLAYNHTFNIILQPASGTGNGNGGAGGGVFNGLPVTGSVGMAGIPVQLQDANGNILKVLHSNSDGTFNFNNLPFGDYGIRVELFGVPSTTYLFNLSNTNPTVQVNFTLGTNGIAASMKEVDLTVVGTYPNPAKDWVRMQLKAKDGQTQTIQLRDIQGKLMLEKKVQLESGLQEIELALSGLSQGVYLLEITGAQKSISRLIIQ